MQKPLQILCFACYFEIYYFYFLINSWFIQGCKYSFFFTFARHETQIFEFQIRKKAAKVYFAA